MTAVTNFWAYLKPSAEQGYMTAQFALAEMYDEARGVELDNVKAAYWYLHAAEQGHTQAQLYLAMYFHEGLGVEKDYEAAAFLYQQAVDGGSTWAMNHLATMYAEGEGIEQDNDKAKALLRKAAVEGDVSAQYNLANIYSFRAKETADFVKAYVWFSVALANGHERAEGAREVIVRQINTADMVRAKILTDECVADFSYSCP